MAGFPKPDFEGEQPLDERDMLAFQLYFASLKPRVKRQMLLNWGILVLIPLVFTVRFIQRENTDGIYIMGTLGLLFAVVFPFHFKWRYRRHYLRHIRETNMVEANAAQTMEVDEEKLVITRAGSAVTILYADFNRFHETDAHYFLETKSNFNIIISKAKAQNLSQTVAWMEWVAEQHGVERVRDAGWKWLQSA